MNDVAERLEALLGNAVASDNGLQVLTACTRDRRRSPPRNWGTRCSFIISCRGWRDGPTALPGGKKDGEVSIRELAAYVAAEVDRWAWHNLPRPPDAASVRRRRLSAERRRAGFASASRAVDEHLSEIPQSGWETHDAWWTQQRTRRTPPALDQQLEAALLCAEERCAAGPPPPCRRN